MNAKAFYLGEGWIDNFEYPVVGTPEVVQFFFDYYGPTEKAYAALDDEGKESLRDGLERVYSDYNSATDGTTTLVAEYLEVEAIKA